MSHSHHIWITRTVTCPFQTPLLTLLYFGNVYFLSDIKSGKIFFSLSWIRIASLSGTLSKFCFPSQEKLLIENQVAGKKKATSNNTCWVTFPTPAVFHLFVFCRYLSDFAIVRHFSTFPSCRHEVVDQRSNFSRDSSIMLESPSKWQIAVMLWSTYCTSLTKSTYQLIQMWGNEDMIWWLIKILSQLLWSMVSQLHMNGCQYQVTQIYLRGNENTTSTERLIMLAESWIARWISGNIWREGKSFWSGAGLSRWDAAVTPWGWHN